jgi:NADH-quinone oxidoreductase subunit I
MFGSGLLKGLGVTLKHFSDTFIDDHKKVPTRYVDSIKLDKKRRLLHQPAYQEGLLTIQYPEEKRLLPERFRFIPMLLWDTEKGEDRCTACGICSKVCPPQCIWIVRDSDERGKPVSRSAEYYIDVGVCMSCSFCVEFCPFDAIKMNHDYELAVYDRYPQLVYDKEELTVPIEYYAALWPTQYAQEEIARKAKEEKDRITAEKKAKAKAAREAAKKAGGAAAAKPKRSKADLAALKAKAAAKSKAKAAGGEVGDDEAAKKKARLEEMKRKAAEKAKQRKTGEGAAPAAVDDEAAKKKARLEEMKRKAAEKAKQRKAATEGAAATAAAPEASAEAAAPASGDDEAAQKKARLEELKRKAAEKAKQRKQERGED